MCCYILLKHKNGFIGNSWIPRSEQQSVSSMRAENGWKRSFEHAQHHWNKGICTVYCFLLDIYLHNTKQEPAWVNIVPCWKSSLLQADNGYLTVRSRPNGSHKYSLISAEPPGVLIRTFLANNQTGNCSLTAGNFHQTAVNLCIRVSSFSLTRRVIPIRQQLILIIQSVS